jgi:hypothetical protein
VVVAVKTVVASVVVAVLKIVVANVAVLKIVVANVAALIVAIQTAVTVALVQVIHANVVLTTKYSTSIRST